MPLVPSREDLQRACGDSALDSGAAYRRAGNVRDIDIIEDRPGQVQLRARTFGSGMRLYEQEVWFHQRLHDVAVEGRCTCAVGRNCKHVAAVCLQWEHDQAAAAAGARPSVRAPLQAWLEEGSSSRRLDTESDTDERLLFLVHLPDPEEANHAIRPGPIQPSAPPDTPWVEVRLARAREDGEGWSRGRSLRADLPAFLAQELESLAARISHDDQRALGLILAQGAGPEGSGARPVLRGHLGYETLRSMVATGRCFPGRMTGPALHWAEARDLDWTWVEVRTGFLKLLPRVAPEARFIPTEPPCYVDPGSGATGILHDRMVPDEANRAWFLRAPELPLARAEEFGRALLSRFPQLPVPLPVEVPRRAVATGSPRPGLRLLRSASREGTGAAVEPDVGPQRHPYCIEVFFDYAGMRVPALPARATQVLEREAELIEFSRDRLLEGRFLDRLKSLGFSEEGAERVSAFVWSEATSPLREVFGWEDFLRQGLPGLEADGWIVEYDSSFRLHFDRGDWELSTQDSGDWFELGFDLEIDGERLPLAPLLAPILEELLALPDAEWPDRLPVLLAEDRYVTLPAASLRPVIDVLQALWARGEKPARRWKLRRFDAALLTGLPAARIPEGQEALRHLVSRLRDPQNLEPVTPPQGLRAELRRYQRAGLDWLQFLRRNRFNGLLADDMGLGKTLQVLAHLLLEKESGRLPRPALVVVPTSLLGTWVREAERFAPDLRVLPIHGSQRGERFARIDQCDLVLTTYPLLSRDAGLLAAETFTFLILDEAQNVKNPQTQAAVLLRRIACDHRLCLTGTPLENHLGELWAQFDFLMPGFLGSRGTFNQYFRIPIERHGDERRRDELTRRIRPFLLRRGKGQVIDDLPSKTEILKTVRLPSAQAQLYESVRVAVDQRVRQAIAERGSARAQITILDALLKLRQICCDPRLLKMPGVVTQAGSAKLELLMDLLPGLIEEGRRILLFSQFTEMLGLIERRVAASGIPHVKLTGETRDRDAVIDRFRTGEYPLFLISLKAGGVGLSLVEADTVILYDPWWNPAIETQAADRAYRIGQDRPVFVYKLVVENSVEARILDLQEKKRRLAEGVLAETPDEVAWTLDPESVRALLAPLVNLEGP